jgi:hypothetical protein
MIRPTPRPESPILAGAALCVLMAGLYAVVLILTALAH